VARSQAGGHIAVLSDRKRCYRPSIDHIGDVSHLDSPQSVAAVGADAAMHSQERR